MSVIRLTQFETRDIFPIESRAPGTYEQPLLIEGNSLLSSVFVRSVDVGASVTVKYFDTTTGLVGEERFDLNEHPAVSTAGDTSRTIITSIHNKPIMEATVSGGNVEFGVYVTVVSTFASDLDSALKLDNEVADLSVDKAIPMACYDEDKGRFFILRCEDGVIPTSFNESGDINHLRSQIDTDPGVIQTIFNVATPPGKTKKVSMVRVACRAHSTWELTSDSVIIGSGFTSPMTPVDSMTFSPRESVLSGKTLILKFKAHSSTPIMSVSAFVMTTDITN